MRAKLLSNKWQCISNTERIFPGEVDWCYTCHTATEGSPNLPVMTCLQLMNSSGLVSVRSPVTKIHWFKFDAIFLLLPFFNTPFSLKSRLCSVFFVCVCDEQQSSKAVFQSNYQSEF